MESAVHRFHELFAQLGLPNGPSDIRLFLTQHSSLAPNIGLPEAVSWTEAQAGFLREALQQDSDWAELVDQLNNALRAPADVT